MATSKAATLPSTSAVAHFAHFGPARSLATGTRLACPHDRQVSLAASATFRTLPPPICLLFLTLPARDAIAQCDRNGLKPFAPRQPTQKVDACVFDSERPYAPPACESNRGRIEKTRVRVNTQLNYSAQNQCSIDLHQWTCIGYHYEDERGRLPLGLWMRHWLTGIRYAWPPG